MTQILAALTQNFVLVVSDRQLTAVDGPHKGMIVDDHACKLVSLCGIWGIAYTGLAKLEGMPTNEWIAVRLAEKACGSPYVAAQILAEAAAVALAAEPIKLELTFLIAGWVRLPDHKTLRPHFLLVSNMVDSEGMYLSTPNPDFRHFERQLRADELYVGHLIGKRLSADCAKHLRRWLRQILEHGTGPKPAMHAFAQEIVNTAKSPGTVGNKILGFSIPRLAAERTYQTGISAMLAKEPDLCDVAFCYFDPAYSELHQYGPTSVCGESAITDVVTKNDPARSDQSSSMKLLHLPKSRSIDG